MAIINHNRGEVKRMRKAIFIAIDFAIIASIIYFGIASYNNIKTELILINDQYQSAFDKVIK